MSVRIPRNQRVVRLLYMSRHTPVATSSLLRVSAAECSDSAGRSYWLVGTIKAYSELEADLLWNQSALNDIRETKPWPQVNQSRQEDDEDV